MVFVPVDAINRVVSALISPYPFCGFYYTELLLLKQQAFHDWKHSSSLPGENPWCCFLKRNGIGISWELRAL